MLKLRRQCSSPDNPVEEARRAMVSAGYVLPPACQPIPIDPPQSPSPVLTRDRGPVPVERRRHSISYSPVANWRTDAGLPIAEPQQLRLHSPHADVPMPGASDHLIGHKRRFSFPDGGLGSGIPLTAYLPDEFKRRRTMDFEPANEECPKLPSFTELVDTASTAAALPPVAPPSACLPPHKAATPDRISFSAPPVSTPVRVAPPLQSANAWPSAPTHAIKLPTPVAPAAVTMLVPSSGTPPTIPGDSSTAPSSPSTPPPVSEQKDQDKEAEEADRLRRAKLVEDILEEMESRNAEAAAAESGGLVDGAVNWPSGEPKLRPPQRRRVGKDQTGILDKVFRVEQMPNQAVKKRLAEGLGMSYKQIQIWFQNKRARSKRATETPQRTSHTFHTMLVSSDGRFMKKQQLAKEFPPATTHHANPLPNHYASLPPVIAMRPVIRSQ